MFGIWKNLKNKAMQAMLEKQLANLPPEQREAVQNMVEANPDLFEKIAKEIEELKKTGVNELYAGMQVMKKYQSELQKLQTKQFVVKKP